MFAMMELKELGVERQVIRVDDRDCYISWSGSPHTSETAIVQVCVYNYVRTCFLACGLIPYILNECIQMFMKIDLVHGAREGLVL